MKKIEWKPWTEHVFYTENDSETDCPCIGYVQGKERAVLLDAGNSPLHAKLLQEGLAAQGLPMPDMICLTHAHWDHTYGLAAWSCLSLAGKKTNENLRRMQSWKWDEEAMAERLRRGEDSLFCDMHIRKEYPDRSRIQVQTASLAFTGEVDLALGGVTVCLREMVSPHEKDCVVMLIPEDGVLFLGDAYCSVPVGEDWVYDPVRLQAFLQALEEIPFTTAIKGHHPPQSKEELLRELTAELSAKTAEKEAQHGKGTD